MTGKRKERDWRNTSRQEKESNERLKGVLSDRTRARGAKANILQQVAIA